jgi:glutaredoxin
MRLLAIVLLCGIFPAGLQASEVYRWKDANGVTHYGDRKPEQAASERLTLRDTAGLDGHVAAPRKADTAAAGSGFVPPEILMYDNPACGYCRKAERWFKANGLAFRSIDVTASKSNHDRFLRDGGRGTPLIFIDGVAVRGFNEKRLQQLVFGD